MISLNGKKILIISPHPDDEAIGCGGLIGIAKRSNCHVHVLFMCLGQSRQLVTGSTEIDTRLLETKNAMSYSGYKYEFAYIGDQWLRLDTVPQRELIDKIEDKIGALKPDVVLIPFGQSYNQDHRATFTAAIAALRPIPTLIRHRVSYVIEYEEPYIWQVQGDVLKPNLYFELTEDDFQFKIQLLGCHKTQTRDDPFARSAENLRRIAGIRGADIGCNLAESYRLLRGVV